MKTLWDARQALELAMTLTDDQVDRLAMTLGWLSLADLRQGKPAQPRERRGKSGSLHDPVWMHLRGLGLVWARPGPRKGRPFWSATHLGRAVLKLRHGAERMALAEKERESDAA